YRRGKLLLPTPVSERVSQGYAVSGSHGGDDFRYRLPGGLRHVTRVEHGGFHLVVSGFVLVDDELRLTASAEGADRVQELPALALGHDVRKIREFRVPHDFDP